MLIFTKQKNRTFNHYLSIGLFFMASTLFSAEPICDMEAVNRGSQQAKNQCSAIDFHKADKLLSETYLKSIFFSYYMAIGYYCYLLFYKKKV